MRHQCTEISSGNHKKGKSFVKPKQPGHKNVVHGIPQASSYNKKSFDPKNVHKNKDRCSKCGDSTHMEIFQSHAKKFKCEACHKFGHIISLGYQKKQTPFKSRRPETHQLQAETVYAQERAICHQSEITVPLMTHSTCKSKCSTHKLV